MQIFTLLLWLSLFSVAYADDRHPAEIVAFQGSTEVQTFGENIWQPARQNQSLPAMSTVRTGDYSWASLLFLDRTQIKISANTIFQIKDTAKEDKGQTVLEIRKGKSWMQSKTLPRGLTVKTPAFNAGIQGTDWVIEVDEGGKTTLSVLSGEIIVGNDQGEVRVHRGEEAVASPGSAPVKRTLINPRERVQWVSSHAVRWERYPDLLADPARQDIVEEVRKNRYQVALTMLQRLSAEQLTPSLVLLDADLLQNVGDLESAQKILTTGMAEYPEDPRFAAALALLALSRDNVSDAMRFVEEGSVRQPDSIEILLAKGEIAHWQGTYQNASDAYSKAEDLAPNDARAYHGNGLVLSERGDYATGRRQLLSALAKSPAWAEALGELGWLETMANDLVAAQKDYEEALKIAPSDYVSLTGMGYLALKSGNFELALRHLLAANAIEPRYARAVLGMAIAYYQQGQLKAALDCLTRSTELDERDPMPWFLKSLIYQDHWQAGEAIRAAREGMVRLPYLKSMNQLATNLQGSANLGSAYSQFGMEDWAMRVAQESYDQFWAGSHFFLANRYAGEFNRNAELTLGFLTDPTAFGVAGRWQPLMQAPGIHGQITSWFESGDQSQILVPGLAVSGYHNIGFPVAWFTEAQYQQWRDEGVDSEAVQYPLGFGIKPSPDWGFFLFSNTFSPKLSRDYSGGKQNTTGENRRIDLGGSYRHSPESQSWLKFGGTRENASIDGPDLFTPTTRVETNLETLRDDVQFRHTKRFSELWEASAGMEWARRDDNGDYQRWSRATATPSSTGEDRSTDKSELAYVSLKYNHSSVALQMDLSRVRLKIDTLNRFQTQGINFLRGNYHEEQNHWDLNLGGIYRPIEGWTVRLAHQDWTRPVSFNTLAPIATAGIPVDDELTLAGGGLKRTKVQVEWDTKFHFSSIWFDNREIDNISFTPFGPDNGATELADLSLLDQRSYRLLGQESIEGTPLFGSGRVKEWGGSHNWIITEAFSLHLRYRQALSQNTRWFADNELPYVPKHQGTIGLMWLPKARWVVQSQVIYRSDRYADEPNNILLDHGWLGTLQGSWQSYRKDRQIDLYIRSLLSSDQPVFYGAAFIWKI